VSSKKNKRAAAPDARFSQLDPEPTRTRRHLVSTDTDTAKHRVGSGDKDDDLPKDTSILAEARSPAGPAGEGSIGYRIAAMVAMFLLALAGILFWYFGR
jgi:hypothetical protein